MRISRRPDFPAHLTTSIDPGRPAAKKVTATRPPVHCHHARSRSTRGRLLPTLLPNRGAASVTRGQPWNIGPERRHA
jgi:hypothetical protein